MARAEVMKDARRLLLLNLATYVLLAVGGAVLIDDAIDDGYGWTAASGFANIFAALAGVVGVAAAVPGIHHVRSWSQGSLAAAASSGFMAWLLTLLALGLAIKEVSLGTSVHDYKLGSRDTDRLFVGTTAYLFFAIPRAVTMGGLSVTQLIYLRIIHVF